MKWLLLALLLSFNALANYPVLRASGGIREFETGIQYLEDEIIWEGFDFYRVLSDFTAIDLATDRGNGLIEKMVDPNDYLVGLTANVQFQLDGLDTRLTTAEADIVNNATNIATNATNISTNASDIANNQTNITTNANAIATNVANISSNDTELADHETRITQNRTDIDSNDTDIATNSVNISTNVLNIASNDTDIADLQSQQTTNTADIATNSSDIASNDTDIATNLANIASNDTDIAANTTNIGTNDTELADHEARIQQVESDTTNPVMGTINTSFVGTAQAIISNMLQISTGVFDIQDTAGASKFAASRTQAELDALVATASVRDTYYNSDDNQYNYFNGDDFIPLGGGAAVGGSFLVGTAIQEGATGCTWTNTSNNSTPTGFAIDADCNDIQTTGQISAPTKQPAIQLTARTDGEYRIRFNSIFNTAGANTTSCTFKVQGTGLSDLYGGAFVSSDSSGTTSFQSELEATIRFNTEGLKTVEVVSVAGTASNGCNINNDVSSNRRFFNAEVYFYPDSSRTIQTADYTRRHARYYKSTNATLGLSAATVVFDTIYPNHVDTLGKYSPSTGIFTETEAGKCYEFNANIAMIGDSQGEQFYFFNSSVIGQFSSKLTFNASINGNAARGNVTSGRYCTTLGETITLDSRSNTIQGSVITWIDIFESPSSGVIVGDFEEIDNTTNAIFSVRLNTSPTTVVNQPIAYFGGTVDPNSQGITVLSSTSITPVESGWYQFGGFTRWANNQNGTIFINEDGVFKDEFIQQTSTGGVGIWQHTKLIYLIKDRAYTFPSNVGAQLSSTTTISLHRVADTSHLVRQIIGEQTTECQIKKLTANVSSNGVVTELVFNNLDITKKYSLTLNIRAVAGSNNCTVSYSDGVNEILENQLQPDSAGPSDRYVQTSTRPFFQPATSTLTPTFTENTSCFLESTLDADRFDFTFATLCELPATTIETNKFQ